MASDNESDSSDFEDLEISEKDMTALVALEQQLEANPSSYDTHLQVQISSVVQHSSRGSMAQGHRSPVCCCVDYRASSTQQADHQAQSCAHVHGRTLSPDRDFMGGVA